MNCELCEVVGQPQKKRSYLVFLLDALTCDEGVTVVQSECACDMQEWLQNVASVSGGLKVGRPGAMDEYFLMHRPIVTHIDAESAAHIPVVDPVN